MKRKTKKTTKRATVQRNTYTAEHTTKARKYYLMGLNLQEISKLMDNIPVRTLEKWQIREHWTDFKEAEPLKDRALSLQRAGRSYSEIADLLKINRTTVWRWLKQAKEAENI